MNCQDPGRDEGERVDTLLKQYEVAVDLYKHEDLLTWQKVNHLLYMNGGMAAIFAFLSERDIEKIVGLSKYQALQYTSWIGLFISLVFSIAIWLGTHYMMARKAAVIDGETKLRNSQGQYFVPIVTPRAEKPVSRPPKAPFIRRWRRRLRVWKKRWLAKSLTVYVLRALPLGFLAWWLLVWITLTTEQQQEYRWDPGLFHSVEKPLVGQVANDSGTPSNNVRPQQPDENGGRP